MRRRRDLRSCPDRESGQGGCFSMSAVHVLHSPSSPAGMGHGVAEWRRLPVPTAFSRLRNCTIPIDPEAAR